jgi:hypothetical protein
MGGSGDDSGDRRLEVDPTPADRERLAALESRILTVLNGANARDALIAMARAAGAILAGIEALEGLSHKQMVGPFSQSVLAAAALHVAQRQSWPEGSLQ